MSSLQSRALTNEEADSHLLGLEHTLIKLREEADRLEAADPIELDQPFNRVTERIFDIESAIALREAHTLKGVAVKLRVAAHSFQQNDCRYPEDVCVTSASEALGRILSVKAAALRSIA
jgi:hypothetical protein